MEKLEIEDKIKVLEGERKKYIELRKPIDEFLSSNYKELEELRNSLSQLKVDEMRANGVDWEYLIKNRNNGMPLIYYFEEVVRPYSCYQSGDWSDTREASIQIKLYKKDASYNALVKQLIEITSPIYTPDEQGYVRYEIFEHNCGENGSFYLHVNKELTEAKVIGGYLSDRIQFEGNLDDALVYIQKNLYYAKHFDK